MTSLLTPNAIADFFTNPCSTRNHAPKVVQVIKVVETALPNGTSRYRMIVSDGTHYINTFMPSKAVTEEFLTTNAIVKNTIIRATEYALKEVNDKNTPGKTTRLVLATGVEVVQAHDSRIGEPADVSKNEEMQRKRKAAASAPRGGVTLKSAGAVVKKQGNSNYDAISSLNPYRNRWTIKARVTKRGDKKTWSNARGEGCLFSVDLLDAEGTEIRATFWKEAVDLFYDKLAPGTVATFSGGKLKMANKQWTSIKNEYEITFDRSATINVVADDDDSIKSIMFEFVKLAKIEDLPIKATIDCAGVVRDFQPVSTLTAKSTGRELFKRDVSLVDDSGVAVRLTLWGAEAQKEDSTFEGNPVLAVKGARIGEFQGKNLSTGFSSTLVYDDVSIPEVAALKQWWQDSGSTAPTKSLSSSGGGGQGNKFENRKGLSFIKENNLGYNEKPDWVDTQATISFIKHDTTWCYAACPEEGNNKKVIEQSDGSWLCEANGKTYDRPEYRYVLNMAVFDYSGTTWVSAFNDQAKEILGVSANELKNLQETDEQAFEAVFTKALFQEHVMTVRCKADSYKDELRVRVTMQRTAPTNYLAESRNIIDALNAMA